MPFLAPALPALKVAAPYIATGVGGLLGGRKSKSEPKQPNIYDQMAGKNLTSASDYFSGVLKDPAEATATTASDLGKQFQQGINFNARNVTRGGGSSMANAEAPFKLASAAKGQQILARMGAAGQLGDLGGTAGRLGLGQRGLDIEESRDKRNFWSDIGSSIGGFLTSPTALSKGSILGRIFGPKGGTGSGPLSGDFQLGSLTGGKSMTDLGSMFPSMGDEG